jgi:hypothetical protein
MFEMVHGLLHERSFQENKSVASVKISQYKANVLKKSRIRSIPRPFQINAIDV